MEGYVVGCIIIDGKCTALYSIEPIEGE